MKIKNLKKAVGDYQRANKDGSYSPSYGELMFDKSTGELWTNYFYDLGHNSWKEYHDEDVINVGRRMRELGVVVNMSNVRNFIMSNVCD